MRVRCIPSITIALVLALLPRPGLSAEEPTPGAVAVFFESDPVADPRVTLDGAVLDRLAWSEDGPAFPGDRPGSLAARYDSDVPAGRIGWPLPGRWDQDTPFTAAAVLVIESEGFEASPTGFFQISWGLWSSEVTGLDRTGSFEDLAGDTFELIEFDYFPNVTDFGGPFLVPTVFGVADREHPLFDFLGSFVNITFGSEMVELPLDEPLLAFLEHRPADAAAVFSVHRITESGSLLPVPGAVVVVPLELLGLHEYGVDRIGLTLWHDGFGGDPPALRARVVFHALVARPGIAASPGDILDVALVR